MNIKVYFLVILLLTSLTSCSSFSNNSSSSENEVIFDDGHKTNPNEVAIEDADFAYTDNTKAASGQILKKTTRITKDGSQIVTTYDGFGNKTETRTFSNNPLLRFIILNTAVDGSKKIFVYGQNGEVKSLPEDVLDKIMTASPTELANSAGIREVISEPSSAEANQPTTITTLKPLPSSQFPIRNQQIERTLPPEAEEPSNEVEKPQSSENKKDNEPSAKSEKQSSLNKKSDN